MKNWKKKALSLLVSAAMSVGLLTAGAFAAGGTGSESAGIRVELNGEAVTFPDAVPEVLNERTFLPMRAVFEALGAEVDYDGATRMVTAVRGSTTVTMTIGSTQATVTKDGVSTTLVMDVPVYAKNNRTFVPVRFAAQALGCVVGWDSAHQTVILVDAEPMIAAAVASHEYTLLDGLNAYSARFNEGNWAAALEMDLSTTSAVEGTVTMRVTGDCISSDGSAAQMMLDVHRDASGQILPADPEKPETRPVTDTHMEVRMDLESDRIYVLSSGEDSGLPEGTWLSMTMEQALIQGGVSASMAQLISTTQSQSISPAAQIAAQTSTLVLTDKDSACETVSAVVDAVAALLADESFVRNGLSCALAIGPAQDGTLTVLTLNTNEAGDVVGYEMSMDTPMSPEELGLDAASLAELAQKGIQVDGGMLSVRMAANGDTMTATVKIDVGQLMRTDLTVKAQYTPDDRQPVATLPEGAAAVEYTEWIAQQQAERSEAPAA